MLEIVPCELSEANEFVRQHHRWPIALIAGWAFLCLYWRRTCSEDDPWPPEDDHDWITEARADFFRRRS